MNSGYRETPGKIVAINLTPIFDCPTFVTRVRLAFSYKSWIPAPFTSDAIKPTAYVIDAVIAGRDGKKLFLFIYFFMFVGIIDCVQMDVIE